MGLTFFSITSLKLDYLLTKGLTTAVQLCNRFEKKCGNFKLDLTIIADKFNTDTTSDGAGGLFRPDDRFMGGVPKETAR